MLERAHPSFGRTPWGVYIHLPLGSVVQVIQPLRSVQVVIRKPAVQSFASFNKFILRSSRLSQLWLAREH